MVPGVEVLGRAIEVSGQFRAQTGGRISSGRSKKYGSRVAGIFAISAERPENNSRSLKILGSGFYSGGDKAVKNNAYTCNRGIKRLYFSRLEAEIGKGLTCVCLRDPINAILRSIRCAPN